MTLTAPSPREAALEYASKGWLVFPCQGKKPDGKLAPQGFQNATTSAVTLRAWWSERPDANVAVATGDRSGIFVLDVDPKGLETLAALELQHGPLPTTVRARTGRNGLHVFFRYPTVGRLGNSAGKLGPGLDTRGQGGYVVLAPSVHPETRARYAWVEGGGPDEVELTDVPAWLVDLLAEKPKPVAAATNSATLARRPAGNSYAEAALHDEIDALARATEGTRNDQLNAASFSLGQLIGPGQLDRGEVEAVLTQTALMIGLEERETARTIRSGIEAGMREPRRLPPPAVSVDGIRHPLPLADAAPAGPDAEPPPASAVSEPRQYHLTDLGNAHRLVDRHGRDVRFCQRWNAWLVWTGARWETDETGEIMRRAKATALSIYAEIPDEPDADRRKELMKHAVRSEGEGRIKAMVSLATSEPGIAVTPDQLDADPWVLNCRNGVLDLRTGALRPHRREDLLTKLAPVAYDPAARSATWETYLDTATGGDLEYRRHLQRAAGYTLTGDTREEKLFFVHGPAATGKSTILEALKAAMGDYALTADFEAFLARRDVGGPRDDIARFAGARLVSSIEVEEGKRLAEGLVKMLTGGDTVTARHLYQRAFEFQPQFKLWLAANHEPRVRDDDEAIWRRILREPFEHVIPEDARDPNVKAQLRDPTIGGPAVLAWAVQGCLDWQRRGLGVPPTVKKATAAYRERMDPLAGFISDCCALETGETAAAAALWEAYARWLREDKARRSLNRTEFARRLEALGCEADRATKGVRIWRHIVLVDEPRQLTLGDKNAGSDAGDAGTTFSQNSSCSISSHEGVSENGDTHVTRVTQSRAPAENAGRPTHAGVLSVGQLVYPLGLRGGWLSDQPVAIVDVAEQDGTSWYAVDGQDVWFPAERLEPVDLVDGGPPA